MGDVRADRGKEGDTSRKGKGAIRSQITVSRRTLASLPLWLIPKGKREGYGLKDTYPRIFRHPYPSRRGKVCLKLWELLGDEMGSLVLRLRAMSREKGRDIARTYESVAETFACREPSDVSQEVADSKRPACGVSSILTDDNVRSVEVDQGVDLCNTCRVLILAYPFYAPVDEAEGAIHNDIPESSTDWRNRKDEVIVMKRMVHKEERRGVPRGMIA